MSTVSIEDSINRVDFLQAELMKTTIYDNPYIKLEPYPKQLEPILEANKFLEDNSSSILVGAGGFGGKTILGSMLAAQYLEYPEYTCLVTRLNYAELTGTDSIWENLVDWTCDDSLEYPCESNESKLRIRSPFGATIWFKAFDNVRKKQKVKSESYTRIINDEASELDPEVLRFLYRSLRKELSNNIPLSFINLSNPGGPSTEYLVDKYVEGSNPYFPLDWRHNPFIDKEQYKNNLLELAPIDQQYQLYGNWKFKPSFGLLINKDNFINQTVPVSQGNSLVNIVSVDLASTGKDSTALTSLNYNDNGYFYLVDTELFPDSHVESLLLEFVGQQVEKYNTFMFIMELEPGSESEYASRYWEELVTGEYPSVMFNTHRPSKSKFERTRLSAKYVRQGKLFFVEDDNTDILQEQYMYVHPDKEEMKKHPSPDLLDSLNQGLYELHNLINRSTGNVTTTKAY